MKIRRLFFGAVGFTLVAGLATAAWFSRDELSRWLTARAAPAATTEKPAAPIADAKVLKLSPQARKNLGLVAKAAKPQTYWRTIQVPGTIVDRPGRSDRGVTAPAVGAVVQVHAFPGDTVKPGDRLFTLRLFSEYLQNTQSELFKATRETELLNEQRVLLAKAAKSGAVAETKLIELDNQLRRQSAAIQAYRQDLLTRGLKAEQIDEVTEGNFVSTIEVVAPPSDFRFSIDDFRLKGKGSSEPEAAPTAVPIENQKSKIENPTAVPIENHKSKIETPAAYEVQDLKVDLGQQVQAGELLSVLSNHHSLYLEGHAFKQEAPFLEKAAQSGWPIQVEFAEDDGEHWPALDQTFQIRHLANAIDTASRTFDFFIPLTNQSRGYEKDGKTFVVWRFRPGQRVRLHVPVEELKDVLVLPSAAIVREGPEAYVFRQNGDLFNRINVHVLHEDRLNVVLANDGSVTPGLYLAQNAAASLNRVLKAQAASGVRADVHVHADGTTH
ncbi:MAG: efflux RND transporter periplasmic adaptor subunit [Planctomycetaceae bacterium]|nr:efflux RND transporter periplasmic adaptor subunit [Planctomycetaceae bacterium]